MSLKPIAYVMEQTLGSITHYLNLRRAETAVEGPLPRWLPIEFRHGRLPWTITGVCWRGARSPRSCPEVDGIFMHTTTIAPLSVDYFRKKPSVLSTDGTPLNKRDMRSAYGLRAEGRAAERAKQLAYSQLFGASPPSSRGLIGPSARSSKTMAAKRARRRGDPAGRRLGSVHRW